MCAEGEECHACGRLTIEKDRGVSLVAVECDNSIHLAEICFHTQQLCFCDYGYCHVTEFIPYIVIQHIADVVATVPIIAHMFNYPLSD